MEVTASELAQHLGVTRQAVYEARTSGRIAYLPGTELYDLEAARAAWGANTDPQKQRRDVATGDAGPTAEPADGVAEARRRELWAKARQRELELAKLEGRLVDAEEARRTWHAAMRLVRDRVLGVPPLVAAELAQLTDPRRVSAALDTALREALVSAASEVAELEVQEAAP